MVLSDRTQGLVTRADLLRMKHTSYLINTSRGQLIDEDALVEILEAGGIAGAGLDTFAHEPLPADRRLHRITEPRTSSAASSTRRLAMTPCAMLAPLTAQARDLVYLSSAVPAGLDVDGPSSSSVASQTGMVNLIEPLVYFKLIDEKDGVEHDDFAQFQGMAAESWSYDPAKFRWIFHLRHDVKSCAGITPEALAARKITDATIRKVDGLENAPRALIAVLSGGNIGKQLVRV